MCSLRKRSTFPDVWETSAKIPYWWDVGRAAWEICFRGYCQWWRREKSAVFSGCYAHNSNIRIFADPDTNVLKNNRNLFTEILKFVVKFRELRLCFEFAFSRLGGWSYEMWKWFLIADDGETPAKKHKKEKKKKKKDKEATKQPDEHDEEQMDTSATVVRTPTCPFV